ncbi:MAG TPA: hypothetical protein DCZ40_03630 [Lachnospiraceae bacterium]|nr:hypothetical protein [Lachnospiraceae bacterium]
MRKAGRLKRLPFWEIGVLDLNEGKPRRMIEGSMAVKAEGRYWMSATRERNWTSFNSGKLFAHYERWKLIQRSGECPPPALITVDPANCCNLSCEWCNAWKVRQNERMLSRKVLLDFAGMASEWKSHGGKYGVEAVCIAGGGEPLCNPHVGEFLYELNRKQIDTATVTNGTLIDKYAEELLSSQYVAVSVDAANASTFNKYKGLDKESRVFDKVIDNMEMLCRISRGKKCNLSKESPSNGVNYRMLLYKDNIGEISEAARIAQDIGCKSLHIRPAGIPYDLKHEFSFTEEELELFREQVSIVERTKKSGFGFYYTLGKFNEKFQKCNDFKSCYAIFMTATLMPASGESGDDAYCLNVCCDRRSDERMKLLSNETDIREIARSWGKDGHWKIFDMISSDEIKHICPRCTYYEHNKIVENCILNDNMLIHFI